MTTADIVTAQPASFLEQAKREARERQQRSAEERARDLAARREAAERRDRDRFEALQAALDQSIGRSGTNELIGEFEEPTYAVEYDTRWVTRIPRVSLVWREFTGTKNGVYGRHVILSLDLHGNGGTSEFVELPAERRDVLDLIGRAIELEEAGRAVAVSRTIEALSECALHPDHLNGSRYAKMTLQDFCKQWGPDGQVDVAFTQCMRVLQEAEDKRATEIAAREASQEAMWWNFKAWRVTYGVKGRKGERWRTGNAWVITPIAENDANGRGWYRTWDAQARKWIRVYYATVLSIEEHSFDMAAARSERLFVELADGLILPPPGTEEQPA